jgi:ppGpp synthetase/RelA/SpoT-type nucleotidyltranferase
MMHSKTKIDSAGRALSKGVFKSEDQEIEAEIVFDDYRRAHLQPLTDTTYIIQGWLSQFDKRFYIAQRLKRRPQILRKMRRFSVRLTQLQDIGGNRVIVDTNADVEALRRFLLGRIGGDQSLALHRETDYRVEGRDDTGYRALHMILDREGLKIELQLRSRAQHHWAESIERTSVIYGQHLKENEGDQAVLDYFKCLSHVFYELECSREPSPQEKMDLDDRRERAEQLIDEAKHGDLLYSQASEGVLQTLEEIERGRRSPFNNWILIFDWNSGQFVNWESISKDPNEAYDSYRRIENQYAERDGFEVVLVGSSDVSMIRRTHSHYFGIEGYDSLLQGLEESIAGFSTRKRLSGDARRVLHTLHRKKFWGRNTVSHDTLRNHYCKSVQDFGGAIAELSGLGLLMETSRNGALSLNPSKHEDVQQYL